MGCGASAQAEVENEQNKKNDDEKENVQENKESEKEHKNGTISKPSSGSRRSAKVQPSLEQSELPVLPLNKPVAFCVSLDGQDRIDNLLKKPPRRLQRLQLDPLADAPKLTASELEEKQRIAEEKRQKQLEKIKQKSRKTSKKRLALQQAKEFDHSNTEKAQEIEEKLKSADKNREAKRRQQEEKKRAREERAKRALERAKKQKEIEEGGGMDYNEVEKDEQYNNDDNDSWLDGEANTADMSERIYSGRESPHKQLTAVRGSAERKARMSGLSASTADSFDYAFQRKQNFSATGKKNTEKDEFFD
ncbi:DgyrCDS11353 [Dimorphilus gyrociliatus]|uniref:DgyrCDS11353 n=1 Tax=Dimorphilus gyrociliatus TaxID=2664684 RepID=A0A7I8W325_9ANNE|nr:DgyrCDS11353 [Dimorphilus gyrociliatus]